MAPRAIPVRVMSTTFHAAPRPPTVLETARPLLAVLELLANGPHVATRVVVCASRDAFLRSLASMGPQPHLTAPTLHNLAAAQHVVLAFCASVPALLTYLTALGHQPAAALGACQRLMLVDLLALHASTPSFSAQGLSKTLATAVEAASRLRVQLDVVETRRVAVERNVDASSPHEGMSDTADEDPWAQELSILNVSARRFGSGSTERAWAGRTITARRVAGRWFYFEKLDDHMTPSVQITTVEDG